MKRTQGYAFLVRPLIGFSTNSDILKLLNPNKYLALWPQQEGHSFASHLETFCAEFACSPSAPVVTRCLICPCVPDFGLVQGVAPSFIVTDRIGSSLLTLNGYAVKENGWMDA